LSKRSPTKAISTKSIQRQIVTTPRLLMIWNHGDFFSHAKKTWPMKSKHRRGRGSMVTQFGAIHCNGTPQY